jgi:hypothetical protein
MSILLVLSSVAKLSVFVQMHSKNQHEFEDACHVAIFDFYRSSVHLIFDDGEPGL